MDKIDQFNESLAAALAWTEREPLSPEAWSKLAYERQARHEFELAVEAAETAVALSSAHPPLLFKLGFCQFRAGRLSQAGHSFERCAAASLELKDDFYLDSARVAASFCFDQSGQREKAVALASQAPGAAAVWLGRRVSAGDILAGV